MLVSANTATAALFGYLPQHLPGLALSALVPPLPDETLVQLLQRSARDPTGGRIQTGLHRDGTRFPLDVSVSRVLLPHEYLYVCILRDLTEQQRSQADIHRLAHTDALTGLENRFALNIRLEQQLAHARPYEPGDGCRPENVAARSGRAGCRRTNIRAATARG